MSSRPDTSPAGSPPAEESLVGRKVDKYELVRVIGRGGMGTVYEAVHTGIGKRVAIKFVDAELARNNDSVLRFQREAQAASAVESAHIVQIFDSGTTGDGLPYLIMELLRGEDLGHRIKRCGRIDPPDAVQVTAQILRGLHRAHEAGIIHRDLKPDNIFLVDRDDDSSFVKILDFGISKVQRGQDVPVQTLTREGTVLGTPHYMSPEQAQALADVDSRADIWSTGAILYECLAGRPPHTGTTYEQVIVNICMKDAEDIRTHNPAVPEPLARVLAKALARERADRFATARDFLRAISFAAEGWIAPSRPGTPGEAGPAGSGAERPLAPPGAPGKTPIRLGSDDRDPSTFEPTLAVKSDAPSRVGWTTSRKKKHAGPKQRVYIILAGAVALAGATLAGALYFRSQSSGAPHGENAGPAKDSHHDVSVQLRSNATGARFLVQGIELPNGLLKGKPGETKKVRVIADGYVPAEQDVLLDPAKEPAAIVLDPAPPAAGAPPAADPAGTAEAPPAGTAAPPEAVSPAPTRRVGPPNHPSGPNSPPQNGSATAPPTKPTATAAPEPTTPATTPTATGPAPQLKIKTE